MYGGTCGCYSIRNPGGMYGGACGFYSPYNISSLNPPVVLYQNQPVLVVTKNLYLLTNGLPVVDPDLIFSVYEQPANGYQHPALAHQQNMADLTRIQLDQLTRAHQANADLINRAIQSGMNLFR